MAEPKWTVEALRPRIDQFLQPLLAAAHLDVTYEVGEASPELDLITPDLVVDFAGPDIDLLLNHRAELLMALEHLTLEALGVPHEDRYRVIFDANDYRLLRIAELRLSAQTAAEQVKSSGRPFHFNPMTSRERRIIHLALRDDDSVRTESEGVTPRRHTVIYSASERMRGR